jgi:hypothetical protein
MKASIATLTFLFAFAAATLAGGSFNLSDIQELLQQQPKRWAEIRRDYDVEDVGTATRFGRQWEHLGGARCGPYELQARKKGSSGSPTHTITIYTKISFFDSKGRKLADSPDKAPLNSFRIKETITSIETSPL